MSIGQFIVEYVSPPLTGLLVEVVRRMVRSIVNFKKELRRELVSLGERVGSVETRMVHLEGAVHQNLDSNPPPKPRRFISEER